MPNWCETVYFFTGNQAELEFLYTKLGEWTSEDKSPLILVQIGLVTLLWELD